MIASLAMYDWPALRAPTGRLWAGIRDRLRKAGIDAPEALERARPFMEVWQAPDLVFSQTCGRPYRLHLKDRVALVGTPDYGLPGCPPGHYNSVFVVRAREARTDLADFADARFAFNETLSQSGWATPRAHARARGFRFDNTVESGGHARSAAMVAAGEADIAALDALSWEMIKRYEPFSLELRVLERSEPTPGLPYIAGRELERRAVFAAAEAAIAALSPEDRACLRLRALVAIPKPAYMALPDP